MKKRLAKRFLSLLLTTAIMVSTVMFAAEVTSASATTISEVVNYTALKSIRLKSDVNYYSKYKKTIDYIVNEINNKSNTNDMVSAVAVPSDKAIHYDDFVQVEYYISMIHPELFFLDFRSWKTKDDITIEYAKFYYDDQATRAAKRQKFDNMAQEYLNAVKGKNDIEKAKALYDAMTTGTGKVKYENPKANQTDNQIVYQAMVEKKGNALSFARIFSYILARANVKNTLDTNKCEVSIAAGGRSYSWIDEKKAELTDYQRLDLYNQSSNKISIFMPFYNKYGKMIEKVAKAIATYKDKVDLSEFSDYNRDKFGKYYRDVFGVQSNGQHTGSGYSGYYNYNRKDTLRGVFHDCIVCTHPELAFYFKNLSWGSNYVIINYYEEYPNKIRDELRQRFNINAEWYLKKISSSMTEFEKALVLHDEICEKVIYYGTNDCSPQTLVYSTMVEGYGICQSYSRVYSYLLSRAGVYSEILKKDGHQLNKVKIGNKYYVVDLTTDDNEAYHTVNYSRFLISEKKWDEETYNYNTRVTYTPTDTKFDNYYFRNSTRRMALREGNLYFTENHKYNDGDEKQKYRFSLLKYDYKNNKILEKIKQVGDYNDWSDTWWNLSFSNALHYYGNIYFNTVDKLFKYNVFTKKIEQVKTQSLSGMKIFGIIIKNNKVYGMLKGDLGEDLNGTNFAIRYLCNCQKTDHDELSVKLSQNSLAITKGASSQLTATVLPSRLTDKTVKWSTNNSTVATVSSNGVVTGKNTGTAKISASKTVEGKTFTTLCSVAVYTFKLSSENIKMIKDNTAQLNASVDPSTYKSSLKYSSSDSNVAVVNNSGKITAKNPGTATITAKIVVNGKTVTRKCTVNVYDHLNIKLSATSVGIEKGKTQKLTATVSPKEMYDQKVTWSTSNSTVATVSSDGLITAKSTGSATITAAKKADGKTVTSKCNLTVYTFSLSPSNKNLNKNKSFNLSATVAPSNLADKIKYTSSNSTVAAVDSTGKVTGKKRGSATITASLVVNGKTVTRKCTVNVDDITGVQLSASEMILNEGTIKELTATVTPTNYSDVTQTYSTSNSWVVDVSNDGRILAKNAGTATITVTVKSPYGKTVKSTCRITVRKLPKVNNFKIESTAKTSIKVSWDKMNNVSGYNLEITDLTDNTPLDSVKKAIGSQTKEYHTFTGLTSGHNYRITISAYDYSYYCYYVGESVTLDVKTK